MNRIEIAGVLDISPNTLRRRMKKKLSSEFLEEIKGGVLLPNHVKHIYENLSGENSRWAKI